MCSSPVLPTSTGREVPHQVQQHQAQPEIYNQKYTDKHSPREYAHILCTLY